MAVLSTATGKITGGGNDDIDDDDHGGDDETATRGSQVDKDAFSVTSTTVIMKSPQVRGHSRRGCTGEQGAQSIAFLLVKRQPVTSCYSAQLRLEEASLQGESSTIFKSNASCA